MLSCLLSAGPVRRAFHAHDNAIWDVSWRNDDEVLVRTYQHSVRTALSRILTFHCRGPTGHRQWRQHGPALGLGDPNLPRRPEGSPVFRPKRILGSLQ